MITFHLFCKNLGQGGIVTEYSKILFIVGNTDYKNSSVELVKTVLTLGFFSEKKKCLTLKVWRSKVCGPKALHRGYCRCLFFTRVLKIIRNDLYKKNKKNFAPLFFIPSRGFKSIK